MPACLDGLVVLELSGRTAVGLCGSLLGQLGARVILAECREAKADESIVHPALAAGKQRILIDRSNESDLALVSDVASRADVILVSTDDTESWDSILDKEVRAAVIVCDISAFGTSGPLTRSAVADELVQAWSGLLETTGSPKEPPVPIGIPITEFLAAIHAASGIIAHQRLRRASGHGCGLEVAQFDCAFESTSTFLARALAGQKPTRVGNRHPNVAPFNAYRTRDGMINMCTGNDEHWRIICKMIGRPDTAADERYATMNKRAAAMDAVDTIVEAWTLTQTSDDCIKAFLDAGIPAGPITPIASIVSDADLLGRGVVREMVDPVTQAKIPVPGNIFSFSAAEVQHPAGISAPDEDREAVATFSRAPKRQRKPAALALCSNAPLSGVLVVEVGQYTTGPRAARHLAALGAEVIKVEMPPNGDPARTYTPFRDGESYFFHLNNSGKQTVVLDLKTPDGAADLRRLLAKADVLIQNMKPGSLSKLGFAPDDVRHLNPRLIYCSVSGYGAKSVYRGRPGMDSVIQAMAGLYDLTRSNGYPYKGGISVSDVIGGQLAVLSVVASLEFRERTGKGQHIDVSMFDGSAWLTQLSWIADWNATKPSTRIIRCSDGFVAAVAHESSFAAASKILAEAENGGHSAYTRAELVELLAARNIAAAPVLGIAEALVHPQTVARGLIAQGIAPNRASWPYVPSPIRISDLPRINLRAAGRLDDDHESIALRFQLKTRRRVPIDIAVV